MACVGHPSTDAGRIEGETSAEVLDAVNRTLRAKAPVTAYKWFLEPLPLNGFVEVSGLPISVLRTSGEYPASLGRQEAEEPAAKAGQKLRLWHSWNAPPTIRCPRR